MILTLARKYLNQLLAKYRYAKQTNQRSFWLVLFLLIYLTFEEFLIKFTPLRGTILFIFRTFMGEFIIYGLFLRLLYQKIFRNKILKPTLLDPLFIVFLIAVLVSILVNQASLIKSLINLRPLLRYIPLYYVVVNMNVSKNQINTVLKAFTIIGLIQSCLTAVQSVAPRSFTKIFKARGTEVEIADFQREMGGTKLGASYGTFSTPSAMTSFLFITLSTLFSKIYLKSSKLFRFNKDFFWILVIFYALYSSLKRASIVVAILVPVFVLWHLSKKKNVAKLTWFYSCISLVLVIFIFTTNVQESGFEGKDARTEAIDPQVYLTQIFTPDYWEQSSDNSRAWIIKTIGGSVLRSDGAWFGLSPDPLATRQALANLNPLDPEAQDRLLGTFPYEDVYWVALLAYYGVVGLSIYILILWQLYRMSRWLVINSIDFEYRLLGSVYCTVIFSMIIYSFIERILETKTFGFSFWLLAGLVTNAYNTLILESEKMS